MELSRSSGREVRANARGSSRARRTRSTTARPSSVSEISRERRSAAHSRRVDEARSTSPSTDRDAAGSDSPRASAISLTECSAPSSSRNSIFTCENEESRSATIWNSSAEDVRFSRPTAEPESSESSCADTTFACTHEAKRIAGHVVRHEEHPRVTIILQVTSDSRRSTPTRRSSCRSRSGSARRSTNLRVGRARLRLGRRDHAATASCSRTRTSSAAGAGVCGVVHRRPQSWRVGRRRRSAVRPRACCARDVDAASRGHARRRGELRVGQLVVAIGNPHGFAAR